LGGAVLHDNLSGLTDCGTPRVYRPLGGGLKECWRPTTAPGVWYKERQQKKKKQELVSFTEVGSAKEILVRPQEIAVK